MKGIIVGLLLCASCAIYGQTESNGVFEQAPLRNVLQYLEQNYSIRFSFKDKNIENKQVNLDVGNLPVLKILDTLSTQTNLAYDFIDASNIIITLKEQRAEEPIQICGFIKDLASGEALIGAGVQISGMAFGTSSDVAGAFLLKHVVQENDSVVISYIGYDNETIAIKDLVEKPCSTILMQPKTIIIDCITIMEYLTEGMSMPDGGTLIKIKPKDLPTLPGMVEPDAFHSLQLIPGINSPTETASGLYIRGGTPDQNLVLWDDIPIYHTGHMFGMISAFNPYFIKNIDVYRSGIAAKYGGRASSVIDIQTHDEAPEKWSGHAGVNLTHLHLNTAIPLWKNAGLQISMRSNVTETLSTPTFQRYAEKVFQGGKVDFNSPLAVPNIEDKFSISDYHAKWLWNPGKSKISASLFTGRNDLRYSSNIQNVFYAQDNMRLENTGLNLKWDHQWTDIFSTSLSTYSSEFEYDYSIEASLFQRIDSILFKGTRQNNVSDNGFRYTNTWTPNREHSVEFGYQYMGQEIEIAITNNDQELVSIDRSAFSSKVHNIFADYTLTNGVLTLNAGIRYQNERTLGENLFAPRMSMHTKVSNHLELKISSSKQFQFISQLVVLELNDIGVGNEIWIASGNEGIPVIESTQWAGGLLYNKKGWSLDVEGYVKELSGITTVSSGFGAIPDQPFSQGASRIRGIDILAKKRFGNWRSWVSYTLAKSEYDFSAVQTSVFPSSHDQRHSFQWVYTLDAKPWAFSMGWQLKSGLPFTPQNGVDSLVRNDGTFDYFIKYGPQNSQRLKPYHRLDASVMYHFNQNKRMSGFIGISFLNIFGRPNQLGRNYIIDDSTNSQPQEIVQVDRAGLRFTPNFVVKVQW